MTTILRSSCSVTIVDDEDWQAYAWSEWNGWEDPRWLERFMVELEEALTRPLTN